MESSNRMNKAKELPFQAPLFPNQIVTGQDLKDFRTRLLVDLDNLIKEHFNAVPKKWLKSHEVRKLLNISPGTLQQLKNNGILPYSKVGGVHYFDYQKIQQILLESNSQK